VTTETSRFEEMALRHRPAIARLCRHYEASAEARRDLEQEIMVALWRALTSFRGTCSEKTFVLRIAHNVAVTHVARAVRARNVPPDDGEGGTGASPPAAPDEATDARALLARIDQRLKAMDVASQQLVLLALEGCTTAEIAEISGLTPTNVTTRLSRLRHALTQDELADGNAKVSP
jgi:RNA polymerase sigma-70 factor (ECF subfamily)